MLWIICGAWTHFLFILGIRIQASTVLVVVRCSNVFCSQKDTQIQMGPFKEHVRKTRLCFFLQAFMSIRMLSAQIKRHLSCPIQKIFFTYVWLTSFFHAFGICFDQKSIIQLNQITVLLVYARIIPMWPWQVPTVYILSWNTSAQGENTACRFFANQMSSQKNSNMSSVEIELGCLS